MTGVDLPPDLEPWYVVCLAAWSSEIKGAGDHEQWWCDTMKDQGMRVKIALDDTGPVGEMIQYLPIEHAFAKGKDLYIHFWASSRERRKVPRDGSVVCVDFSCGKIPEKRAVLSGSWPGRPASLGA
jgi:hypothetical protein